MKNQHRLVCFALCLTIVAAVVVDKDFLANHPKRQTLESTYDNDLTDAALERKQNRAEEKEYFRWHQAGSKRIISAEEEFAGCVSKLWETMTDATARSKCALALGHVLTDERPDTESSEEAAERQVLFVKATTAYDDLVTNMASEEANLTALKTNATALTEEARLADDDVEGFKNTLWHAHEENSAAFVRDRPGAYEVFQAREKELETLRKTKKDNKKHVDAELKEVTKDVRETQVARNRMAKKLRHATAKFRNYRAQHEAEIAPKKTNKSVKSSAHRQFHVIEVAAIAMIALAY